jgi:peptidoglycan/LPS O-acetylase OafA/YrhL
MVYVMVESFRFYVDRTGRTGRIWRELNRNSYGVYIIHVIVIGIFGTLLLNLDLPALAKYPMLIVLTYVGSNLVVSVYRTLVRALKASRARSVPPAVEPG